MISEDLRYLLERVEREGPGAWGIVLREGDEEAFMVAGEQLRGRYRDMIM